MSLPVVARRPRRRLLRLVAPALLVALPFLFAPPAPSATPTPPPPFLGLRSGYTAELYGLAHSLLGGVAFVSWSPSSPGHPGSNGDLVADQCSPGHSGLIRFDASSTRPAPDGVTMVHPQVLPYLRSDTGCGIANSSDGHLYAAVDNGIAQLDGKDGHFQRLFASRTNTLGVAVDPVTRSVAFLDHSCDVGTTGCTVHEVDPVTGKVTTFARLTASQATFVDGIAFEPRGQYLLLNTRAPRTAVTVVNRAGNVVQQVGLVDEPDGIVFHVDPDFALLNDTDGSLVELDFPSRPAGAATGCPCLPDYTGAPAVTLLASGGFRGDLAAAGPDGCMYLTQDHARLASGLGGSVVASDSSVVLLCGQHGSFVSEFTTAQPRPTKLTYNGATTGDFHDAATVSAALTDVSSGAGIAGALVTFALNQTESCAATTDASGTATCNVTPGEPAGGYGVTASFAGDADYLPSTTPASFAVTLEETTVEYTGPPNLANGNPAILSAILREDGATALAGRKVTLTVGSGAGTQSCSEVTTTSGTATCALTVNQPLGPGTASAGFAGDAFYRAASVTRPTLVFAFLSTGSFVVGDKSASGAVTFWGAQWSKVNQLSQGDAPSSFKGFAAATTTPPACGAKWTTGTGNSAGPPASVPSYMAAIVATSISKSGSTISGDTVHIVIVKTDAGYAANPGHAGTGTIVATLC